MTTSWSIGEFATVTHLSIRTLRRYHESGLLEPQHVDPHSGYRYCTPDQIPTAQVIRRFRELDMPVREPARGSSAPPRRSTSTTSSTGTRTRPPTSSRPSPAPPRPARPAASTTRPVHPRPRPGDGPRDTDDRVAWRTEIGWPVFTTAP